MSNTFHMMHKLVSSKWVLGKTHVFRSGAIHIWYPIFWPFLTYPPTHIRSYPILKKGPNVGYQIFEKRPTQVHDMYLILLSINKVLGRTLQMAPISDSYLHIDIAYVVCSWFLPKYVGTYCCTEGNTRKKSHFVTKNCVDTFLALLAQIYH